MNIEQVMDLARKYAGDEPSARLCLDDAEVLYSKGRPVDARRRAIRSLEYSIGILHPDYKLTISGDK